MGKYLIFAFYDYYPRGGTKDFQGSFDTIQGVREWIKNHHWWDEIQVVDRDTFQEIDLGACS